MKMYLDCYVCVTRQALEAARMATDDEYLLQSAMTHVVRLLSKIENGITPVDLNQIVHRLVREVTGVADPYKRVKRESNDLGLKLYSYLKSEIEGSKDPLLTALNIAGAGNIIDFGPKMELDTNGSIEQILKDSFTQALKTQPDQVQYGSFKQKLENVGQVLYLGDNTGEIVCDKLLIEQLLKLGKKVTFVARGKPTINDATQEDASCVGLDELTAVISNGSDAPGTRLEDCSLEFRQLFDDSELIISKGQGNFEGLSDVPGPIFFLLKVKCPVIAREVDADIGDIIFKEQIAEKVTK